MKRIAYIRARIAHFLRDESATSVIEFIVVFPLLLWAYMAMYVFWDAYKVRTINTKAAFTISDMMARRQVNVTPDYVDGLNAMLAFLNKSKYQTQLRVSVIAAYEDPATGDTERVLCWSEGRGDMVELADMSQIDDKIPLMAAGSEVIFVETETLYRPIFRRMLRFNMLPTDWFDNGHTYENNIAMRPRAFNGGRMRFEAANGATEDCDGAIADALGA